MQWILQEYNYIYVAPDRTKLETEKHINLVSELKARRTQGEFDLVIRNGSIVKVKSKKNSISTTVTSQQRMESSTDTPERTVKQPFDHTCAL